MSSEDRYESALRAKGPFVGKVHCQYCHALEASAKIQKTRHGLAVNAEHDSGTKNSQYHSLGTEDEIRCILDTSEVSLSLVCAFGAGERFHRAIHHLHRPGVQGGPEFDSA